MVSALTLCRVWRASLCLLFAYGLGAGRLHAQIDFRQVVEAAVPTPRLVAPVLDSLQEMQRVRQDIDTLCSDHMAGRGYTHQGHLHAARWLAHQLQRYGLSPLCGNSYLQPFDIRLHLQQDASLAIGKRLLRIGYDFMPDAASAALPPGQRGAFYVGYGLPGSYRATALKGKVAILEEAPPKDYAGKPVPYLQRAYALWEAAKPAAIVVRVSKLTHGYSQQAHPFALLLVQTEAMPGPERVRQLSLHVAAQDTQLTTHNVLAYLPSTRSPDTLIVLGAHYDHLGRVGTATFYGAGDNASGVAFLLSLARYFAQPGVAHPYSLAFVFFGAEEVGLLGSLHYVQSPCWSIVRTRAMLNFDLMANGQQGIMTMAGKAYPQLFGQLAALNDSMQAVHPLQQRENRPNSDHFPFTQVGVPALFFYTQGGPPHYHDVHDQPNAFAYPIFWHFRRLIAECLQR